MFDIYTQELTKPTKIMKRYYLTIIAMLVVAISSTAATVENEFFSISTPDDSWFLTNDDALRPYGARVDIARIDARGATLELARVDYIEGAFDPTLYLTRQIVGRKDVFCRAASQFSSIYDYSLAGFDGKCVEFKKTSNNHLYQCEAVTFNAGFGTFLVIMAHRADQPSLIARIVSSLTCKMSTTPLVSTASYVTAASQVVKRHHLPIGNNEHLSGVEMSADSSTVSLMVTVPYITKENVNVPAFVMTKRDAWFKQAPDALDFNLLLATATRERKNLRYFYADTKGNEIGTLLIMPEEYDMVNRKTASSESVPAALPEAKATQEVVEPTKSSASEAQPIIEAQEKKTQVAEPRTHTVKAGDNLTKIAKRYGVSITHIRNVNPAIKNDQINIGQQIVIPPSSDK